MNMVSKWNCYKGTPYGAKSMYLRAVALLRKQETLEAFEKVAEQIFMLALSENADVGSSAEVARIRITQWIKGHPDINQIQVDEMDKLDTEKLPSDQTKLCHKYEQLLNIENEVPKNTFEWTSNLYEKCIGNLEKESKGSMENVNGF